MTRVATIILWVLSLGIAGGTGYWVGLRQETTLSVEPKSVAVEPKSVESDVQIVQPLTEPQRQMLLRTPAASIVEGMVVTVSQPGKAPQVFLAKGKLDLPDKKDDKGKKDTPPLNNPFKDDKPPRRIEVPDYVPYPCQVGRDSSGKVVWGVCFKRKF